MILRRPSPLCHQESVASASPSLLFPLAAVLAQKVCVDKASVCSKRNLQNIAQSITMKEARGMFVSGMMSTGAEYDGWAPSGSAATKKKEL